MSCVHMAGCFGATPVHRWFTSRATLPVELVHVQEAAARLRKAMVPRTPVLRSAWIDAATNVAVHFKCEHMQITGSFKYRGATNAVFSLDNAAARHGIVAHSSGNHGAGCAAAAAARGVQMFIYTCVHIHTYIQVYVNIFILIYTNIHTYIYIYVCIYIYIYMYICIFIHICK